MVGWVRSCIEADAGAWDRLAETVFAADLRDYAPFLARLATMRPGDPEGASGRGKGRQPDLESGDRYHMPRRILTVWQEPDPLTRAKCLFLMGFVLNHQYLGDGIYRPIDRVEQSAREAFERLQPAGRAAYMDYLRWCEASIPPSYLDYQARKYLERMIAAYGAAEH